MSSPAEPAAHRDEVPLLEEDETVPPRPEEEVADLLRSKPLDNVKQHRAQVPDF